MISTSGSDLARQRLIKENEIPSLPAGWDVRRFRFLFRESKERNGAEPIGNMLSVSEYRGVVPKEYEHDEQRRTDDELQTYRVVRPGQLAVNTMWLNHLGLGVSDHLGHVSPAYAVYDISDQLERRFVHHLFRSQYYLKIYLRYLYGIRPNSFQIKTDDWNSIPIIVPPYETQRAIADFLDRETARIDQLIEKKQLFVKVILERRLAMISHAVVKGLRPEASLRNSGFDWLGSVPEHWSVLPLKYLVSKPLIDGPHVTPERQDDGVPFISAEAISGGYINFEKKWGYVSDKDHSIYSKRYSPRRGDLLMVKLGATSGMVAMVETDVDFSIWVPIAAIRPKNLLLSKYIFHALQSTQVKNAFQVSWTYGTQQTLGLGTLSNLRLPVPPETEMKQIVDYIEQFAPSVEVLAERTTASVDRLRELRAALITAAVTGQIDVATWGKQGQTDRRLDQIEGEMSLREARP